MEGNGGGLLQVTAPESSLWAVEHHKTSQSKYTVSGFRFEHVASTYKAAALVAHLQIPLVSSVHYKVFR